MHGKRTPVCGLCSTSMCTKYEAPSEVFLRNYVDHDCRRGINRSLPGALPTPPPPPAISVICSASRLRPKVADACATKRTSSWQLLTRIAPAPHERNTTRAYVVFENGVWVTHLDFRSTSRRTVTGAAKSVHYCCERTLPNSIQSNPIDQSIYRPGVSQA